MRVLLVLLVLLFLPLAGCLGSGTGPAPDADGNGPWSHGVLPAQEVWVESSVDGARLHHAVYAPDGAGPFPVFINFSPYWGDTAMAGGDAFARYMVETYVPHGYVVVLSAVRGTGHSEGCFQIGGDLEVQDAHDVVDHFAKAPYSGAVAAGGKSYDSTTQNGLIAKAPHPALRGVFHVSGISDMYRYSHVNGVPYANGLEFTPRYYATQGLDEYAGITNGAGNADDEDPESLARLVDDVACAELPRHAASGQGTAASGQKDAYWQERDWNRYIADSTWNGSVFFVHGLQDWNVKPDHVLPWIHLLPAAVQERSIFWLHQDTESNGHVYPMRDDWNATMLRWLDSVLKDIDTGLFDEPAYQVEGSDGVWRATDAWPPGDAVTVLLEDVPSDAAHRVSGTIDIVLDATVTHADPVLSLVVTDGTGRWVTEGVLRGIYKDGLEAPVALTPGTTYAFAFSTYPVDHVVPAGEGLHLGLQEMPRRAVVDPVRLEGVVLDGPVEVRLDVVPADRHLMDPQPPAAPCFAC